MEVDSYAPYRTMSIGNGLEHKPSLTQDPGDLVFLYIGNDRDCIESFNNTFRAGFAIESLQHVKYYFEQDRLQYPDVIFIDIPWNKESMKSFHALLVHQKVQDHTIVIYNSIWLSADQVIELKRTGYADDVTTFDCVPEKISKKIAFLKKVKTPLPGNFTTARVRRMISRERRIMYVKRIIDIVFVSVMLITLLPVFLLIAIAIRIDSKGPVIYSSLRAGRGFKIFRFYKFRTMIPGADKQIEEFAHLNQYVVTGEARFVKIENDPRITNLGRFLRNTSLDELPQLINVLIGDMSLVGNRPLPLYEASTLTTNEHVERFMAPAGITGLWQIKKRGKSDMSTEERINLDISYARRYGVVYDMWIVAHTPAALFQKTNA